MMRIIINADDCGKTQTVNKHIEQAILQSKITSTTVMANMDDFEGAVDLYKKYNDHISFGWHINLTEGKPLLNSQLLLDKGYYVEVDGVVVFNGKAFWGKRLSGEMKKAIILELKEQYSKLRDSGIVISHADSHQHIHTSMSMLNVIPNILNELKISKVRGIRNYMPFSVSYLFRQLWRYNFKYRMKEVNMTDYFVSYKEFTKNPMLKNNGSIELMCHPGHDGDSYMEEEKLLLSSNYPFDDSAQIINYRDL